MGELSKVPELGLEGLEHLNLPCVGSERGPGAKGFTSHVGQHSKHISLSLFQFQIFRRADKNGKSVHSYFTFLDWTIVSITIFPDSNNPNV